METQDRLRDAEIGTLAPSINGGSWMKTDYGWQWNGHTKCPGSTFPTPGGDWSGELIPPDLSRLRAEVEKLREALEPFAANFEARRDAHSKRYKDRALGYANFDKMPDHWKMDACIFDMGTFRHARKALEGAE